MPGQIIQKDSHPSVDNEPKVSDASKVKRVEQKFEASNPKCEKETRHPDSDFGSRTDFVRPSLITSLSSLLPESSPVKILLVDDQPNNLLALEAILKTSEVNVVKARSGLEALR